jgi:hypothetical protein
MNGRRSAKWKRHNLRLIKGKPWKKESRNGTNKNSLCSRYFTV